jgi:hypothetical protein
LDEHAARSASGVEDAAVEGFDDFDDELDDADGGEEFAAFLSFGHGELAEEVFVDFAEGVAVDVHGDGGEVLEEGDEEVFIEAGVVLGQDPLEVVVLGFDGLHGVVDGFADVGAFGKLLEVTEAGGFGEVEDALGLIVGFADGAAAGGLGGEAGFGEVEFVVGVAEEDEAEDGDGVFLGF